MFEFLEVAEKLFAAPSFFRLDFETIYKNLHPFQRISNFSIIIFCPLFLTLSDQSSFQINQFIKHKLFLLIMSLARS